MTGKPQRAAIYARVSTDETRQNPETQLRQLREYAAHRGFQIVGEYIDYASGKHLLTDTYRFDCGTGHPGPETHGGFAAS